MIWVIVIASILFSAICLGRATKETSGTTEAIVFAIVSFMFVMTAIYLAVRSGVC